MYPKIFLLFIFLSGIVQGTTGFGFSFLVMPFLFFFIEPSILIPVSVSINLVLNIFIISRSWRDVHLKRILPLIISGLIGVPFGVRLLKVFGQDILTVIFGLVLLVFAIVQLSGIRFDVKNERLALFPVGLLSGLLNGAVSLSGPPVILFFSNQKLKRHHMRANLVGYFLVLNLFTLINYYLSGVFVKGIFDILLIFVPVVFAGAFIGVNLIHFIPDEKFRKFTTFLVLLGSLISISFIFFN